MCLLGTVSQTRWSRSSPPQSEDQSNPGGKPVQSLPTMPAEVYSLHTGTVRLKREAIFVRAVNMKPLISFFSDFFLFSFLETTEEEVSPSGSSLYRIRAAYFEWRFVFSRRCVCGSWPTSSCETDSQPLGVAKTESMMKRPRWKKREMKVNSRKKAVINSCTQRTNHIKIKGSLSSVFN